MDKLVEDSNFLAANNLIDYSLLLGEIEITNQTELREQIEAYEADSISCNNIYISKEGKAYLLGIVDPLTNFNC